MEKNNKTEADETNHDLVYDHKLALKLAGNKPELADEMLNYLIESLPTEIAGIQGAFKDAQYSELQKRLHKLHGAVCYCGLPRLKRVIAGFESALKESITSSYPLFMKQLEFEIKQVIAKIRKIRKP